MKLKKRIKKSLHTVLDKYILLSFIFCLMSFALPVYSNAENDFSKNIHALENIPSLPEYKGKLDLSLKNKNDIQTLKHKNKINEETEQTDILSENNPDNKAEEQENENPHIQKAQNTNTPITEDNDNIMIIEGSKNRNQNSVNSNTGFYMNITNPDGSAINFGTYSHINSSSNQGRKKSNSQIVIDKIE